MSKPTPKPVMRSLRTPASSRHWAEICPPKTSVGTSPRWTPGWVGKTPPHITLSRAGAPAKPPRTPTMGWRTELLPSWQRTGNVGAGKRTEGGNFPGGQEQPREGKLGLWKLSRRPSPPPLSLSAPDLPEHQPGHPPSRPPPARPAHQKHRAAHHLRHALPQLRRRAGLAQRPGELPSLRGRGERLLRHPPAAAASTAAAGPGARARSGPVRSRSQVRPRHAIPGPRRVVRRSSPGHALGAASRPEVSSSGSSAGGGGASAHSGRSCVQRPPAAAPPCHRHQPR